MQPSDYPVIAVLAIVIVINAAIVITSHRAEREWVEWRRKERERYLARLEEERREKELFTRRPL